MFNRKIQWTGAFGMASTWFGLHCGGGFATGAQGVLYFTQFGAWELITTFIAALLMAIYAYTVWDYARVAKTHSYRTTYNALFRPYHRIFATLHEVLYLTILVMAMGGVFSGAANVTVAIFPQISYRFGAITVALIVLLLVFFGDHVLFRFSSILSVILILAVGSVTLIGIISEPEAIRLAILHWETEGSFGAALKAAIIYASFQATVMIGTVGLVKNLKTEEETKLAGILGFAVNFLLMVMISTMMLGFFPGVIGQELPIKTILDGIDLPMLTGIYYFALYLACLTTGMTLVGSLVKRFEPIGATFIPNPLLRARILAIGIVVTCFFISLVGLLAIIGKGYALIGYIAIPCVYIPTMIIAPIKKHRLLACEQVDCPGKDLLSTSK